MEIQQSAPYAAYIRSLQWIVETVDGAYIYIKPFPVIGGFAKIQRVTTLPPIDKLIPILTRHHVRTLAIEPDASLSQRALNTWRGSLPNFLRINTDPFLPTKTIRVDLTPTESGMFRSFTEAKRRAVRRAQKYGIVIRESRDIDALIRVKNKSAGFMGFITTSGVRELWRALPENAKTIALAYTPDEELVGGVLLIFWDHIAYYWIAGAVLKGKKMFAPTLLVWESFILSKQHHCRVFDFVGVWDERNPSKNHEWKGFTKFKEGFGGTPMYYPFVNHGS